jgi:hypothetical protein
VSITAKGAARQSKGVHMVMSEKSDLFQFMLDRVRDTKQRNVCSEPQAFGRWFAELFFLSPRDVFISDGSKDGKIDLFFTTHNGKTVLHHVLNTKFTSEYNKIAPPSFYEEMKYFWHAFENHTARSAYLKKAVKRELQPRYRQLFDYYDNGTAELMFVTNHRRNDAHFEQVKNIPLKVFHLDDLIQCIVDDIDGAMPRTPSISLNAIHGVLSPDREDTEVATSIVFARLVDFLRYMDNDQFDLLFNRNVRVAISLSRSDVNRAVNETFRDNPREFAFSNNGITMLCERQHYDPGKKILSLDNPRVVNGSQTLHSIRDVANPSDHARVMVRVIEIEPPSGDALDEKIRHRKEIINKIAIRSNKQNPIKSWDLASNDEFQLDLFRFFRGQGLFYERRTREWSGRSRELRSMNIRYGSSIKWLTQLIASFHWSKPRLGPVVAKNVAELFEGHTYDAIRRTTPETAFQVYLLDLNLGSCRSDLSKDKVYIANMGKAAYFALFSLIVRALQEAGAKWGDPTLSERLGKDWQGWPAGHYQAWRRLTKAGLDQIVMAYKIDAKRYAKTERHVLSYANYFKNQGYISRILEGRLTPDVRRYARSVVQL